jgi:hypothetical protein
MAEGGGDPQDAGQRVRSPGAASARGALHHVFRNNAGPPMLPNYFYNNSYTIVQSKDTV